MTEITKYCDDCEHFRPDEAGEHKPIDELCEFIRPLKFKMADTDHDFIFGYNWGFYFPGCKDHKQMNKYQRRLSVD